MPNLNEMAANECRACSNKKGNKTLPGHTQVYKCAKCQAIFGHCYLGDSYALVRPAFSAVDVPADRQRYFDFETLGSAGLARRHGWFDPETKLITQVG